MPFRGNVPFRGKSIRRKIVGLLLVPLLSLTVLWAFATAITGKEAADLLTAAKVSRALGDPAEDVITALQTERRQALVVLATPRPRPGAAPSRARATALTALRRAEGATDQARAALRSGAGRDVRDDMSPAAADWFAAMERRLDRLPALRSQVRADSVPHDAASRTYDAVIEAHIDFLTLLGSVSDAGLEQQRRALVGLGSSREALSRADALFAAASAGEGMDARRLRAFSDHIAERTVLYRTNVAVLPAEDREMFDDYWRGTEARALEDAENAVVLAGPGRAARAVAAARWRTAASTVLADLARLDAEANRRHQDRLDPVATWVLTKAALAGVLGLAALVASVVVSWRTGRGLVRDLRRIGRDAHEASGVRLPAVLRRLAAGEPVDVEAEAPRRDHPDDELGQVGRALNTLERAAVEAAVKQADLRRGVSDVFVNIARRSQVLLHRQLALLDTMERRTDDPDELADLFRLDHLTTRMRRHAEGLVILSGAAPSRQWRRPVRLMDVVRAAVGEVEAYERIEVRRLPALAVQGPAVADLTHLLAELLENATVFSPPHTAVQVVGERVPNGFTLEIHDRGLGMDPDALTEANLGLAEAPEFELSDTDRLGLFVVSRLARRQGVRVSLQPSPYGGTTAVVLLPAALLSDARPAGPSLVEPVELAPRPGPFETPSHERPGDHDEDTPVLPRRVRRTAPAARPAERSAHEAVRDAEDVRARMASLQRGWRRGRADATEHENDTTGITGTTGTTDERDGR
ncbi:nitrate- and nitrite sensing domain-containing protein [Streptomyces caatingaensis]|uniref:sensor histidine kinase n=1 Tax=Streptomyces caatingaensis TaxID=1678637 RepID=UPI003BAF00BB